MSYNDPNKIWKCDVCYKDVANKDFLLAVSPFDPDETIIGCPHCKSAYAEGSFTEICEKEGCYKEATCGTPLADGGYLRCCFKHYKEINP